MKNLILGCFVFFLSSQALFSQKINGKIIDARTLEPMSNVAVQLDKKTGTYSDNLGLYEIDMLGKNQLIFSCLGYTTRTLSLDSLKILNFIVALSERENNLKEVELNSKTYSLDSLLFYIEKNKHKNYDTKAQKQDVFLRKSNRAAFDKVDFDLDRSTLLNRANEKLANKELNIFSNNIKNSKSTFYTDYYATHSFKNVYVDQLKKTYIISNIDSAKAYRISTNQEDFTLEKIQEKGQQLVLNYLDKTKSYKVKTGFFKVDDTISIQKINRQVDSRKNTFDTSTLKSDFLETQRTFSFLNPDSPNNFLDTNYYKYQLKSVRIIDDELTYELLFYPRKSKAKFSGTLYVNAFDFAVRKVTYSYAKGKRGEHMNLKLVLGVKYSENTRNGTIRYQRDNNDVYRIHYAKEEQGRYFYVNRSFKFIEYSSDKNKIKFGVKLEGNIYSTTEMVVTKTAATNPDAIKMVQKRKLLPFLSIIDYHMSSWKNGVLLKPFSE
ncbi:hypothetical protein GCM10011416_16870 [Polaribacter pacificus]|uniref:CarboxypepD_reg-like domain-containing protein n=1 Tax=Polaribacter pacificus TaxID=1775173 RepID=A0A917I0A5_9FLAO|nr:carboxypeptidase-like regulatory domain-containing protein [Polaribacter pacificus]GGG99191.1 hypothetical protein GCM10011416_16870 [Polaribacter pacificus]